MGPRARGKRGRELKKKEKKKNSIGYFLRGHTVSVANLGIYTLRA
jgi:hypothetical protein